MSEIGHGLWGMGDWSGSTDETSLAALEASLAAGCDFYDSAGAYGMGRSDRLLGELIARHPGAHIVTAGKVMPKNMRWPASADDAFTDVFPLDHVLAQAEESRERMGVQTIDVMQLHVWHDAWTKDPAFERVATELKERKIAAWFGLSLNRWEPWNGIEAIRTGLVDTVQVIYNIFDRSPEDALFPACAQHDVGVIARVPLDEGSLSGRLTLETRFPDGDWRAQYFGPENLAETVRRVDALKPLVPAAMTLPEMALRFILEEKTVSTVIAGMRSSAHVEENTRLSDGRSLEPSLVDALRRHRWDRIPAPWSD